MPVGRELPPANGGSGEEWSQGYWFHIESTCADQESREAPSAVHCKFVINHRGFSLHHDAFAKAVVSPWLEDLNPLPSPLAQSRFFIEERELKHRIHAALFN